MRQVKTPSMRNRPYESGEIHLGDQISAALAWWRDAGVDRDFHDTPQSWLAAAEPEPAIAAAPAAPVRPPEAPAPTIARAGLPDDLTRFGEWWMTEPSLDGGRSADRVPPRGPSGAKLMILVPHPERTDEDRLLAGPQGRLLDAMLAAMGIAPDETYYASALPRHTPHADWAGIAALGMPAILARHVALARPARVLAFGNVILPLLSNDPTKNSDDLDQLNHESGSVPLLVGRDLAMLLERPGWKSRVWTRWLDWAT